MITYTKNPAGDWAVEYNGVPWGVLRNVSEEQIERIISEMPANGRPIPTRNEFELALYVMPDGSKFATLRDESQETFDAYALALAEIAR